ncbi:MAG: hypothetical protein QXW32_06190 [Nitrososphaerales archaeon]
MLKVVRGLLYLALALLVLVAFTPTREHSIASQVSLAPRPSEEDAGMKLSIVAVKLDKEFQKAPYPSATIRVDVKVSNQAFAEKKDLLLTLAVKDLKGDVVAASSTLIYIPLNKEGIYTNYLLLRSGGAMVVEATIHISGSLLAIDHYYIDVPSFKLL